MVDLAVAGVEGQGEGFVPHLTGPYSCTGEPLASSPPHCVLKSFPHLTEHCAAWAREKVHSLLVVRPRTTLEVVGRCREGGLARDARGAATATKFLRLLTAAPTWATCVAAARTKWAKYFQHKAAQLLATFPPSALTSAGAPFWCWPKVAPRPLAWDRAPDSPHPDS